MTKTYSEYIFNAQVGIIALEIKARGGNNADVAQALREIARRYDERAEDECHGSERQGSLY